MKKIYLLLIFIIIGFASGFSQSVETVPNALMIGNIEIEDFQKEPFMKWYKEEYNNYQIDTNTLKNLSKKAKKVEVKIFFGSWCSDSRREVPRFIKIMEAANIKIKKLHFQGLDRAKTSPEYQDNKYGIQYVPTFIFFRKGKEIGRIIETPIATLEKDIIKILNQN
jgi:thiol-disulfide isomerase/thioredoxin